MAACSEVVRQSFGWQKGYDDFLLTVSGFCRPVDASSLENPFELESAEWCGWEAAARYWQEPEVA